jgi:hypothetical protein
MKGLFGSSIVSLLMLDETSGTTAADSSAAANCTGTYVNTPGLGLATAPYGNVAPTFNGSDERVNWYTAALASAFNNAEATVMGWFYLTNWDTATAGGLILLQVDANNYMRLRKGSSTNQLLFTVNRGGTVENFADTTAKTNGTWYHITLTMSVTNDRVGGFINGAQSGSYSTGLGTWAGALNSALCTIMSEGAGTYSPGGAAVVCLLNREATPTEIQRAYNLGL